MSKRKRHDEDNGTAVMDRAVKRLASSDDFTVGKVAQAREALQTLLKNSTKAYGKAVVGAKLARKRVKKHPYQALGMALGLGAAIGYVLGRKHSSASDGEDDA
jgi:ElaB/YqjD/DUF883 family membrane-anchored ribosome-binding protein